MLASLSIRNLCASLLARFVRDQKGAITVVSAIAIPVLIGVTGLVAELGHGLLTKSENQRIADLAAYAGALAYNSTSSSTNMTAAAQRVATMNGIPSSAVSATLVTSPRDSSSQAVLVNISTSNLVLLAPVTKTTASLTIGASSYAQLGAKTDPCIIALNASGTGVTLSGGTSVTGRRALSLPTIPSPFRAAPGSRRRSSTTIRRPRRASPAAASPPTRSRRPRRPIPWRPTRA